MAKQSLAQAVDQAIEAENRRFLASPDEVREAQREGDAIRHRLEAEGVLPVLEGDVGCTIHRAVR